MTRRGARRTPARRRTHRRSISSIALQYRRRRSKTASTRLLATLPGVVPFSYNEPVINGFHGVTYNIDGAPLPLATTSNFAEIVDPKNIDSIELLTGAIPAEYGGDRMGGVVNIITNRPTDIPERHLRDVYRRHRRSESVSGQPGHGR